MCGSNGAGRHYARCRFAALYARLRVRRMAAGSTDASARPRAACVWYDVEAAPSTDTIGGLTRTPEHFNKFDVLPPFIYICLVI